MPTVAATVRFQQTTALPKDVVENNFAFLVPDPITAGHFTTMDTALNNFYEFADPGVGVAVSRFLSGIILRGATAMEIRYYDITASLGGGRHGTPIHTSHLSLLGTPAQPLNLPNQDACVLSFRSGHVADAPVGTAAAIPSDDRAIDEGAPLTHPGFTRPLERVTGRVYIGPLNAGSLNTGTTNEPRISTTFRDALLAAAKKLLIDLGLAIFWGIWSRRAPGFANVTNGWVDDRFDAQRRRESAPTQRTLFP